MLPVTHRLSWRQLLALLLCCMAGSALAQQDADPPGRVAFLAYHEGSVVYAPAGDDEWVDLPPNRPLTVGDRLWTDRGARAELQVGPGTLHIDSESHLGISALDEQAAQFILQQGTMSARVRDLASGENFEVDTPNVAVRAMAPGDYRVDVAIDGTQTRVTVNDGLLSVFGERGQSVQLANGQQVTFTGRQLARLRTPELRQDEFDLWAAERKRAEDESRSARYLPRGVIGYANLDRYGQWLQDPDYGPVWIPNVSVADWAPYRYGSWDWIAPWGWTWVDNAPWGFAPFHYGRWTMVGHHWAWVPGRLPARPAYAPALVVFLGAGPEVGWYPLAPGEAWYPTYRASPRYLVRLNANIDLGRAPRLQQPNFWRDRPDAVTVLRDEDFRRGRPVQQHWEPLRPGLLDQARVGVAPPRPLTRIERDRDRDRTAPGAPRVQLQPPISQPAMPSRAWPPREAPMVRNAPVAPQAQRARAAGSGAG